MKFIFQRDRTIVSKLGHAVHFPAKEPTYAPPALHTQVLEAGGEPADEMEDPRTAEKPKAPNEPTDPGTRGTDVFSAIEMLVERNGREDFTAAGAPHLKALHGLLGWTPSAAERDEQWVKFSTKGKGE